MNVYLDPKADPGFKADPGINADRGINADPGNQSNLVSARLGFEFEFGRCEIGFRIRIRGDAAVGLNADILA
jgi:hypothetical protein